MKRFIMTVPIQPEGSLHKVHYESIAGEEWLSSQMETRFPITIPIEKNVSSGEKIKITAVLIDRENVPENYGLFKEEIEQLSQEKNFEYEISEVRMPNAEDQNTHMKLFKDIARIFADSDNEELYACITYGTKPMPMLTLMALTFAYKLCDNFTIESIVYGSFDHSTKKSYIYDVSSLFYMNSAVNNMAKLGMENPLGLLENFMN